MLAVVGLTLDVIGAVILALGLLRGVRIVPIAGTARNSGEVAADRASAIVGVGFLILGFGAQGANTVASANVRSWPVIVAGTLVVGVAVAAIAWWLLRRRLRR